MIALLFIIATATLPLGDDNVASLFHDSLALSHIWIQSVDALPQLLCPPIITGGDELGSKLVGQ